MPRKRNDPVLGTGSPVEHVAAEKARENIERAARRAQRIDAAGSLGFWLRELPNTPLTKRELLTAILRQWVAWLAAAVPDMPIEEEDARLLRWLVAEIEHKGDLRLPPHHSFADSVEYVAREDGAMQAASAAPEGAP